MSQVFTTESDGKDFDRNVRYDPMPTDAGWHDRAVPLVKWPMKRTPLCEKCKKFIYPRGSECPCKLEEGKDAA